MTLLEPGTGTPLAPVPFTMDNLAVLTLVLTPERPEYPAGSLPDFKVALKNNGKAPAKVCTYMMRQRLLLAMVARDAQGFDYGMACFKPFPWEPFKPAHIVTLAAGQQISEVLAVSKAEGWGLVRTGDRPPVLRARDAVGGFPTGEATFSTLLFDHASIYRGAEGLYDENALETRAIPDGIPGAPKSPDVYRGDIRGNVKVKFSPKAR